MADRVELAFREAAQTLIPHRAGVLAAVSGGADSVALLHLLHRLARRERIDLAVAHLDHGMRRGSRADRRFVERLAGSFDLPFVADRREVPALRRRGESPEEAARRVRRGFLLEAAAQRHADVIATGHTLDDQAETVLMRLVRGAGSAALAGMEALGPGPFVRPLLRIERASLRDWLRRRELAWREDPSNADLRFDRNRARRLVLPVLTEALNPRAARHLVKAAGMLREDALHLDELARRAFARVRIGERDDRVVLDVERLRRLAGPIARRVALLALRRAGVDARRVATRHVEALLDLAEGPAGREIHLPGRIVGRRRGKKNHRPGPGLKYLDIGASRS